MAKWKWHRGEKKRIAAIAKVSPAYLADVLARRRCPRLNTATRLHQAAQDLEKNIPLLAWLGAEDHPAFVKKGARC